MIQFLYVCYHNKTKMAHHCIILLKWSNLEDKAISSSIRTLVSKWLLIKYKLSLKDEYGR